MRTGLVLSLMLAASTATADCPQSGSGTCTAATEAAVAIQNDMPQDLRQMRLMFAIAGGRSVVVSAVPMIGGPLPDPADAAAWLCGHPVGRAYLDSGGRIEVLMYDEPFLDLNRCEAP